MQKECMFVTFEGIDGSGKSTQSRLLRTKLEALEYKVILTREPGGSPGAEEIRKLLVEGEPDRWSAKTEMLLFNAARMDHLERTIRPALEAGAVVVCDRYVDSTRAYQSVDNPRLRRQTVDTLHTLMEMPEADLTIVVDVDPAAVAERMVERGIDGDRFDGRGVAYQNKLRATFLDIARQNPGRCKVVSGLGSEDEVFARVWEVVQSRL